MLRSPDSELRVGIRDAVEGCCVSLVDRLGCGGDVFWEDWLALDARKCVYDDGGLVLRAQDSIRVGQLLEHRPTLRSVKARRIWISCAPSFYVFKLQQVIAER